MSEKIDEFNDEKIFQLCAGPVEDRDSTSQYDVRGEARRTLQEVLRLLQRAYDLTLLEGMIACDEFHGTKQDFKKFGANYGYINSFVRRENGSNTFRFSYRRPILGGGFEQRNIKMGANGYGIESFARAAHGTERELALITESHYHRLREQGKSIRAAARKLRSIEIVKVLKKHLTA